MCVFAFIWDVHFITSLWKTVDYQKILSWSNDNQSKAQGQRPVFRSENSCQGSMGQDTEFKTCFCTFLFIGSYMSPWYTQTLCCNCPQTWQSSRGDPDADLWFGATSRSNISLRWLRRNDKCEQSSQFCWTKSKRAWRVLKINIRNTCWRLKYFSKKDLYMSQDLVLGARLALSVWWGEGARATGGPLLTDQRDAKRRSVYLLNVEEQEELQRVHRQLRGRRGNPTMKEIDVYKIKSTYSNHFLTLFLCCSSSLVVEHWEKPSANSSLFSGVWPMRRSNVSK